MGVCRTHPTGAPRGGTACCTLSFLGHYRAPPCPTFGGGWVLGPHGPGMAWCSSPGLVARDQGQRSSFPFTPYSPGEPLPPSSGGCRVLRGP